MKKTLRIIAIILLLISLIFCYFAYKGYRESEKAVNNSKESFDLLEDLEDKYEMEDDFLEKGLLENSKKEKRNKSISIMTKKLLETLNKRYGTKNIVAYLTTGENGIKEPISYSTPNVNMYGDFNGRWNKWGHVFLYWQNKTFNDEHLTIFGHNFKNNIQFGKLSRYPEYKNELKYAKLYLKDRIEYYELVGAFKVDNYWYNRTNTWTKEGMKYFLNNLKNNSKIYYDNLKSLNIEEDKTMLLSTCANYYNDKYKEIGLYKLVSVEGYSQDETINISTN